MLQRLRTAWLRAMEYDNSPRAHILAETGILVKLLVDVNNSIKPPLPAYPIPNGIYTTIQNVVERTLFTVRLRTDTRLFSDRTDLSPYSQAVFVMGEDKRFTSYGHLNKHQFFPWREHARTMIAEDIRRALGKIRTETQQAESRYRYTGEYHRCAWCNSKNCREQCVASM